MKIIITHVPLKDRQYAPFKTGSIHTVIDFSDNPLGFVCQGLNRRVIIKPEWCEILEGGVFLGGTVLQRNQTEATNYQDIPPFESEPLKKAIKYGLIIISIFTILCILAKYAH